MSALNGRESVPNTLRPPPGYVPTETPRQRAHRARSEQRRVQAGLIPIGRPLSPRAVRMLGLPCPGGWASASGYNNHGCRCEQCRGAMSAARVAHLRRQRAAA